MTDIDMPLISVVVPIYNTGHVLVRCLDSICSQTYTNLEIICVDDGSTDNSGAILQEYAGKDKRIRVITQSNQGLSAARNAALDIATGVWIAGVDSDDYIDPDTYESCLPVIRNTTAQIICYGTRVVGHAPLRESYLKLRYAGLQEVSCELLTRTNVCFWNKLYNRAWLEETSIRFPHGMWFEDEAFFHLNAVRATHIHYLPEVKYNYVVNTGESIMDKAERGHDLIYDRLRVLEYILEHFKQYPIQGERIAMQLHIAASLYFSYLRMSKRYREESWNEVWQKFRNMVDTYGLLDIKPPAALQYAAQRVSYFYYCPPGVAWKIQELHEILRQREHLSRQLDKSLEKISGMEKQLKEKSDQFEMFRKQLISLELKMEEQKTTIAGLEAEPAKLRGGRKILKTMQNIPGMVKSAIMLLRQNAEKHRHFSATSSRKNN